VAPRQRAQFEVTGTGNRDKTRDEVFIVAVVVAVVAVVVAVVAVVVATNNNILNCCHENRCPFMQNINIIKKYSIYIFSSKITPDADARI
jgi:hypothetical protein